MVNTANPLAAYEIAAMLKECVEARLGSPQVASLLYESLGASPLSRSCVITGDIAWDDCECGQLVVSIGRNFLTDSFPSEGINPSVGGMSACAGAGGIMGIDFTISILRCSPSGGDDAEPPLCEDLDIAAQVSVVDAWAVRTAVQCCLGAWSTQRDPLTNAFYIKDFIINAQSFVGSDGMCQGSELALTVGIINGCVECEDS